MILRSSLSSIVLEREDNKKGRLVYYESNRRRNTESFISSPSDLKETWGFEGSVEKGGGDVNNIEREEDVFKTGVEASILSAKSWFIPSIFCFLERNSSLVWLSDSWMVDERDDEGRFMILLSFETKAGIINESGRVRIRSEIIFATGSKLYRSCWIILWSSRRRNAIRTIEAKSWRKYDLPDCWLINEVTIGDFTKSKEVKKGELERKIAPLPTARGRLFVIVERPDWSFGNKLIWSSIKKDACLKR